MRHRRVPAKLATVVSPYRDHWEYLDDRLQLLDSRLAALVESTRLGRPITDGQASSGWGHGMFVSDEEVDAFLTRRIRDRGPEELSRDLEERGRASVEAGIDLPMVRLSHTFRLNSWEDEVLMLCLAPEVDRRYERVFGYLHDDMNRRHPSVELALSLLGSDIGAQAASRVAFTEQGTLARAGLLAAAEGNPDEAGLGRISQSLRLDPRIRDIVLGLQYTPSRPWVRRLQVDPSEPTGLAAHLASLARETLADGSSQKLLVSMHGGGQAVAIDLAAQICGSLGAPLVLLDLSLLVASGAPFQNAVREAVRETLLEPCALLVDCGDTAGQTQSENDLRMAHLTDAVTDFAWLAFVLARHPLRPAAGSLHPWLSVELPAPDLAAGAASWLSALSRAGIGVSQTDADSLAARYRVAVSQLEPMLSSASMRARLRGADAVPEVSDVEAACRDAGAAALVDLANRVSPRFRFEHIVLPAETARQLEEIIAAVKSRRRVLTDWGLGARLSRAKGLSALFSGAPGTGKTMAAEIIAGELGLDLYTVDLATVVSKYIGETEKNLSRIFTAAEETSSVLFFDEADALFGKRSEVTDAHDRYANIEISYLLQRIDTYEGLVILATNLKRNLDEAFLRRLNFVVELPFPDVEQRRRIWQVLPPPETPVARDIDWDFLAEKFALSGGNIKGAFLHATYQAAARNRPLGMADLIWGLRREMDKMGRVTSEADFGPYWRLIVAARR